MSSDGVTITEESDGGLDLDSRNSGRTVLDPPEVAALRAYFAAEGLVKCEHGYEANHRERLPEDVKKLVDEAHGWCPACGGSGMVMEFGPTDCPNLAVHRALEAAQRSPANPVVEAIDAARDSIARGELASVVIDTDDYPQHPPVSPEAVTVENSPTLAAHAEAAKWGYNLSSTEAAHIAEAVLAASGLREAVVEERKANGVLLLALHERPPVSGDYTHIVNLARASEAADNGFDALVNYLADLPTIAEWRPPVSGEVREAADVWDEGFAAGQDPKRYGDPQFWIWDDRDGTFYPRYTDGRERRTNPYRDALLARFSFPPQPVYDEEAIARWLMREFGVSNGTQAWMEFQGSASSLAAALVAALRGGELTREETNGG